LEQLAGLAPVTAAYDARGRHSMLTEGTRVTTFGYASNGYLASIEDALSRRTLFEHDAVGRVTRQVLPDGQEILYGYDANGNVTSITPPGRPPHGFATNAIGLLTAYTPPGVPGLAKTGTTYTYDLDRNLTSVLRPDDLRIDYRYDTAGRLSRLELPQGYGLPAESIGYGYSATTGQLTSLSHSAGVRIDYTYDGFLPTTEIVSGLAPSPIVLERRYDGDFRLNSEKVGNTASITFAYDGDGLLTQAGALTLNRNADNGLLLGTTIGSVTDTLSYNSFGELVEYVVRSAGEEIFRTQFVRDALGRIARKTETVDRTTTTFDYAYDLAGRLTRVIRNGQPWSEYGYDANGNRISATTSVPKPKTVRATYDVQDRLLSYGDATHTHTANGELRTNTQGGRTTTYGYDVLGNLRFADLPDGRRIEYLVDGRGRRVGKKINGVLVQGFVYGSQLAPATELDGKGNVVARFVYGTDLNVPEYMTKNGSTYRIITDHLGSPRMVVDASSGAVVQRIDYDEWGVTLNDSNPSFTPFGFAGGLHDEEVGLERFGARDYDPTMGRWLIKDPILFRGGDLNLFQYAGTDPVNVVDANGYDVIGGSVLPGAFPIPPGALPIPPGGISVPPTEPMPPGGILTPPTGDGDLPAGSDGGCGPTDGEGGVPAYLAEGETSEQGPKDNDKGKGKGKEKDKDGRVPRGKRGNVDDEAARLGDAENDPNLKRKGNRFNKSKQDLKQQIKNQYGGT
jgi:RHS repeat-associated protein